VLPLKSLRLAEQRGITLSFLLPAGGNMGSSFASDAGSVFPALNARRSAVFASFCRAFAEQLSQRAEFSFSPAHPTPEIAVEGGGPFFARLREFLHEAGCREALPALGKIVELFPSGQALAKVTFAKPRIEVGCYFGTPIAPARASEIAAGMGLAPLGAIGADLATLFDRGDLFLGIDMATGAPAGISLCLNVPQKYPLFWPAAASAMALLGLPAPAIRAFMSLHERLAAGATGFSYFFSTRHPAAAHPRAKIDYEDVPLDVARELLGHNFTDVRAAADALGRDRLSYLSATFGTTASPSFKVYFRKRYRRPEEHEKQTAPSSRDRVRKGRP